MTVPDIDPHVCQIDTKRFRGNLSEDSVGARSKILSPTEDLNSPIAIHQRLRRRRPEIRRISGGGHAIAHEHSSLPRRASLSLSPVPSEGICTSPITLFE